MSRYTQGPWKVFEKRHPYRLAEHLPFTPPGVTDGEHVEYLIGTEWIHPQLNDHDPVVTTSVGIGILDGPPVHMVSMTKGNAQLIASAPEMLEALHVCSSWFRHLQDDFKGTAGTLAENLVNTVIDKAEGR